MHMYIVVPQTKRGNNAVFTDHRGSLFVSFCVNFIMWRAMINALYSWLVLLCVHFIIWCAVILKYVCCIISFMVLHIPQCRVNSQFRYIIVNQFNKIDLIKKFI